MGRAQEELSSDDDYGQMDSAAAPHGPPSAPASPAAAVVAPSAPPAPAAAVVPAAAFVPAAAAVVPAVLLASIASAIASEIPEIPAPVYRVVDWEGPPRQRKLMSQDTFVYFGNPNFPLGCDHNHTKWQTTSTKRVGLQCQGKCGNR